jgi:hypothetical protein
MPTSRSVAVGVFADDSVDATKDSESMENGARCMQIWGWEVQVSTKRDRELSSFSPAASFFFSFAISPIDNALFVLFALPKTLNASHSSAM